MQQAQIPQKQCIKIHLQTWFRNRCILQGLHDDSSLSGQSESWCLMASTASTGGIQLSSSPRNPSQSVLGWRVIWNIHHGSSTPTVPLLLLMGPNKTAPLHARKTRSKIFQYESWEKSKKKNKKTPAPRGLFCFSSGAYLVIKTGIKSGLVAASQHFYTPPHKWWSEAGSWRGCIAC